MTTPGPGRTMFAFVRHWSRRDPAGNDPIAARGRHVLVTEAVDALTRRGAVPTVNAVAIEIGIDQSGASRLARAASDAGYLSTGVPAGDARRRRFTVTAAGAELLDQAHAWQERVFDRLAAGWDDARRSAFRQAMTELVERSRLLDLAEADDAEASDAGPTARPH